MLSTRRLSLDHWQSRTQQDQRTQRVGPFRETSYHRSHQLLTLRTTPSVAALRLTGGCQPPALPIEGCLLYHVWACIVYFPCTLYDVDDVSPAFRRTLICIMMMVGFML